MYVGLEGLVELWCVGSRCRCSGLLDVVYVGVRHGVLDALVAIVGRCDFGVGLVRP